MTDLEQFTSIVESTFGMRVDAEREGQAKTALQTRAAARGLSTHAYIAQLAHDREEHRALVLELTVGETYFFRHEEQITAFAEVAVPTLAPRGALRVLSAGCSTGEEPYTLAMVLHDRLPPGGAGQRARRPHAAWRVVGADVNRTSLEKARRGRYSRWSLRATPAHYESRWFTREGSDVILAPGLRADVTFEERNFATDDDLLLPGRWDVVFCRNVLMYFSESAAHAAIARFVRSLSPGGYLFLGHAESLRDRSTDLELCSTHGTFYYRRTDATSTIALPANATASMSPRANTDVNANADTRWIDEIHTATQRVSALTAVARPNVTDDTRARTTGALADDVRPGDTDALVDDALAALHTGRMADAAAKCSAALALDPANAPAQFVLAQCRETEGDTAAAIEHARRAAYLDPTFAMAHLLLGLLARRTGDRTSAKRDLITAIETLGREDAARIAKFGGGLGGATLVEMCRAELARLERG
jgi:chemotaxis protein methyltransferase CheR